MMMKGLRNGLLFTAAVLAFASHSGMAASATFPERPIRFIVPYPAGGTTDMQARLIANQISRDNGIDVIIENRPGAGGNIGVDAVARAEPDGYTIGITGVNSFAINPHLTKKLPYDPLEDLAAISLTGTMPNVVVVNPDVKATNLNELAELSKQEKLSFATPGAGTSLHMIGELLKAEAGIDMLHVAYKGDTPALQDVLGGRVTVMVSNIAGVIEYIRAGRLRPLAVTTAERIPALPDVPTVGESRVPGFDVSSWFAVFTASGVPQDRLVKLNELFVKALDDAALKEPLAKLGIAAKSLSLEDTKAMVHSEHKRWGPIVEKSGASWD